MTSKLYALHGLRAVAATMVAVAHLILRLVKYDVISPSWQVFAAAGSAGVYTFFSISGFIMVKTSGHYFGDTEAPRKFFVRRIIRIVPAYFIFTFLFTLKLTATGEHWTVPELIKSLLFIPYMNEFNLMQPVYSLGWTLNYEMYFYAIFALCLFLRQKLAIAAIFAAITSVVLIGYAFGQTAPNGDPQDVLGFFGSPIVLFFLVGMGIALIPTSFRMPSAVCLVIATAMVIGAVVSGNPIILAISSVMAVFVTTLEAPSTVPSTFDRTIELLGESSYSIYLTHSFVLGAAVAVGRRLGVLDGTIGWVFAIACIVACVVVGVISYLAIESPLLTQLRRRLLDRRGRGVRTKSA